MSEKSKKKNDKLAKIAAFILIVTFALIAGVFGGEVLVSWIIPEGGSDSFVIFYFIALILLVYITYFLQIIIHETGHLIFGLLSGYKFSSFRIGSFMLTKSEGKFHLKKNLIAGTGGQCLLSPPQMKDGKFPVILYNLGGVLLNLISAFIFLPLGFFCSGLPLISAFFFMMFFFGVISAILNGIPIKSAIVPNDGYNTFILYKYPEAVKSLWLQLRITEEQLKGVRAKDMPEELFRLPDEEGMKNCLTAADAVFFCSRLIDEHKFSEAAQLMEKLLDGENAMVELHRRLMKCDLIYCELIGENRPEKIEKLMSKGQKRFMKQMKNYPSVMRTEYTYALFAENNTAKMANIEYKFEKSSKSFPYPSEITAERELIEIAKEFSTV